MSEFDRLNGGDAYFEDTREPVILTDDLVPQRPDWMAPVPEEEAHLRDYLRVLWALKISLVAAFAAIVLPLLIYAWFDLTISEAWLTAPRWLRFRSVGMGVHRRVSPGRNR